MYKEYACLTLQNSYMVGQPLIAYLLTESRWASGSRETSLAGASAFSSPSRPPTLLGPAASLNNPSFFLITGQYYMRDEHVLRACIRWSRNALGTFSRDLIACGIGHGYGDLSPWKDMFIAFGGVAVLWSIVLALFLPDSP
ncbi:Uncharacterized protein TPAR_01249 [Tolypocladium paradoxum]|uniref:Uncharacterized protein n=1 Tax=Tolypocladium paradoxum TaxID=94208 RepID=A0A2S4L7Y3_9HYPO|nr:Uncharacterized protein TPAR_01249 [Tolypocladium paradoxum]